MLDAKVIPIIHTSVISNMTRADVFRILKKKSRRIFLSSGEFSQLHLGIHQLYTTGDSITADNMSEEEKMIARSQIDPELLLFVMEQFDGAVASSHTKEIFHGLNLYRTEIVPVFCELAHARSALIEEIMWGQLKIEMMFAYRVVDYLSDLTMYLYNKVDSLELQNWDDVCSQRKPNNNSGMRPEYSLAD